MQNFFLCLAKRKNFLFFLLPFFIFLFFNALANTSQAAIVTVGTATASPGDTNISVPVTLANAGGDQVSALNFDINYDQNALTPKNVTIGAAAQNASKSLSYNTPSAGRVRIIIYGINQTTIADGVLANLIFDVSSSATLGDKTLTFSSTVISSPSGTDVVLSVVYGKITVVARDTTPPARSNGSPSGTLTAGTTQATLSLTTNENATCKYSISANTAYVSMGNAFSTTGATTHSIIISGLINGQTYNYYVRCQDQAGNANTDDYLINFSVSVPLTLSISLSASPNSGPSPLNSVSLTGTVSGTATGNINYTFYCNRSDTGINITTPYDAKYDNQTATSKTAAGICNYANPGTYTAKVIAERGSLQAQSQATITVSDGTAPVRSSGAPAGILAKGTTQATLSLTTNENATCKYSISANTAYASMANTFSTTGATSHSTTVTGLTDGNFYSYYVRCKDQVNNANADDYVISFAVDMQRSLTSYKTQSLITIDGALSEPVWSSAPSVTFSNAAKGDNTVKVSTLWDNNYIFFAYQVTDSSLNASVSARDGSVWNDDAAEIFFDTLNDKAATMQADDYHYAVNINNIVADFKQTDIAWNGNLASGKTNTGNGYILEIKVPWTDLSITPSNNKTIGLLLANDDKDASVYSQFDWVNLIATGNYDQPKYWGNLTIADNIPPARANGSPSGTLAIGTTQATLSLQTDENATCRWSATANVAYGSMSNTFSTTGGTTHSTTVTGLTDGQTYNYYVRCQDSSGNANTDDYLINFSIAIDNIPPVISSIQAIDITTGGATIAWATNENSTSQVEYGLTASYGTLTTLNSGLVSSHSVGLISLSAGTTYHFRVRSKDAKGNEAVSGDSTFTTVAFNVADVNSDGLVNTQDLQAAVNHILGTQSWPRADVDGNSSIDAKDLQKIANAILGV